MSRKHNPPTDLPVLVRAAPIDSVDAERRTMEVVWTVGARVDRYDWLSDSRYVEELVVTEQAVRLGRLQAGGPVLDNHRMYGTVGEALAVIERAWIEGGKGLATIRFPSAGIDDAADRVFRKIEDGIISSLSCGYKRHRIEIDKSVTPNVWRVVDWEPFEISFVLIPADPGARVRSEEAAAFRNEVVIGRRASTGAAARRIRMRAARRRQV